MADLKLKIMASFAILAVLASSLGASAADKAHGCACTYSIVDLNHDGIIDMKDFSILAPAWLSMMGDANYNSACDFDKNGIINGRDVALLAAHWTEFLNARVLISPRTLNLKSHGKWVTCIILLPAKVNASDIEISSIKLNNTVAVSSNAPVCRFSGGLIVKFSREAVITLIRESLDSKVSVSCGKSTRVTLTVNGTLSSGLEFSGSDTIRVLCSHKCNH